MVAVTASMRLNASNSENARRPRVHFNRSATSFADRAHSPDSTAVPVVGSPRSSAVIAAGWELPHR